MNNRKPEQKMEEKEKNRFIPNKRVLTPGLFSHRYPLNQKTIFFITNSSEDKSKGSSLYFVSPRGSIRCRSDLTRDDRPPIIEIHPYMVDYCKPGEQKGKAEAAVGLYPFEGTVAHWACFNWKKEKEKRFYHHSGHRITEIISLEQFNDLKFIPKTWINREGIGLLWSSAVDQIKEAEASARLNKYGHFIRDTIIISDNQKNLVGRGCIIS